MTRTALRTMTLALDEKIEYAVNWVMAQMAQGTPREAAITAYLADSVFGPDTVAELRRRIGVKQGQRMMQEQLDCMTDTEARDFWNTWAA